jgi:hypothetical protein
VNNLSAKNTNSNTCRRQKSKKETLKCAGQNKGIDRRMQEVEMSMRKRRLRTTIKSSIKLNKYRRGFRVRLY